MSRSILAATAVAAVALAIPQVPAMAEDSSITIRGPGMRAAGIPADGVHQRMELVADVKVYHADLDLRTAYGRDELKQRVRLAADRACDRIDAIDPPVGPGGIASDAGDCRFLAMRNAEPYMQRAIWAAG
ncbi:MAG TPA: UrcA family protein [Croceibacterium sp.]